MSWEAGNSIRIVIGKGKKGETAQHEESTSLTYTQQPWCQLKIHAKYGILTGSRSLVGKDKTNKK